MKRRDASQAEKIEVVDEEMLPVPMDRGFAWVVMLASLGCNFVVDGIMNSYCELLVDFIEHFNDTPKATLALIGSLHCGVSLIIGPVAGGLVNKFGCRLTCIAGSVIACVSFIVCSFSQSVTSIVIFFGVAAGSGFGLVYLPAIVVVNFYFRRRRSLAVGLSLCGSGIGTAFMGPLVRALLSAYGWQSTLVLMGGIALHCAIFGALMRPIDAAESPQEAKEPARSQRNSRVRSSSDSPALLDCRSRSRRAGGLVQSSPNILQSAIRLRPRGLALDAGGRYVSRWKLREMRRPLYQKDIFFSSSVHNLTAALGDEELGNSNSLTNDSQATLYLSMLKLPADVARSVEDVDDEPEGWRSWRPFRYAVALMTNLRLLRNQRYVLLLLANLVCITVYHSPSIFISDYAKELGVPETVTPTLISAYGVANTVARVAFGLLANRFSALNVCSATIVAAGLSAFALVACRSLWPLMVAFTAYGFLTAPFISLVSVVLCSIVGLENMTSGFGLLALVRGVAVCYGPPMTGSLYTEQFMYSVPFAVTGGLCILSGVMYCALHLPCFRTSKRKTHRTV